MGKLGNTYGSGSMFKGKESVEGDPILTISGVRTHVWEEEGKPDRPQWILAFENEDLEFGLNWTNVVTVADICCPGVEINDVEDSSFIGHKIQLYWERTVMYKGALTGGIRVKKPQGVGTAAPAPTSEPTWGADSAGKFQVFLIDKIKDCTQNNVGLVVSEIANRLGVDGSDIAAWPKSNKTKAMAMAETVAAEIADGKLDLAALDESSIPF